MANLSIRNLEPAILRALRIRAAKHGISMAEEVQQILKHNVQSQYRIGDIALSLFGPQQGIALKLSRHIPHEPLDFSNSVS